MRPRPCSRSVLTDLARSRSRRSTQGIDVVRDIRDNERGGKAKVVIIGMQRDTPLHGRRKGDGARA